LGFIAFLNERCPIFKQANGAPTLKIPMSGTIVTIHAWNKWVVAILPLLEVADGRAGPHLAELFPSAVAGESRAEHHRQEAEREQRRGRPKKTVVTGYLIFDDSVHIKPRVKKIQGLGQHDSSTEQRVATGHNRLAGLSVLLGRRCPLPPRLYRQPSVCQKEHAPFQSKMDLVIQEIERLEPVEGAQTHVLLDRRFHCKAVRQAAQGPGGEISGGLKSNRTMRLINPDGTRRWMTLAEYTAQLRLEDWQNATWPSQQGQQKVDVHIWQHGNTQAERVKRAENLRAIRKQGRNAWKDHSSCPRRS